MTEQAASRLLSLEHYGFQDQEFDAQLEYFAFYDLPAPSVPLITPEFTRPLFLKILCEGLKDLGRRSQHRKLREIASGQKGMTYVLEYYTKKVGRGIERDLGLASGGCWLALKGSQADAGLAGRMAAQGSDWLSTDEAIVSLEASLSLTRQQAEEVLRRFIHEGLLAAAVRRHDSEVVTWRPVLLPAVRRSLDREAPARRASCDGHRASAAPLLLPQPPARRSVSAGPVGTTV